MNITPTARQVTDYSFTLSSQDLERYLADPQAWAADVRAQLNGAAPAVAGQTDHNPKQKSARSSKKVGGGRRAAKSGAGAKKASRKPTLSCPVCRAPFKSQKRLSNHLAKAHPDYEPKETYSP